MDERYTSLTMSVVLPCGCEVRQTVSDQADEEVTPEQLKQRILFAAEILPYWYEHRFFVEKRHRCELVSADNPNGLAPKKEG